MGGSYPIVVLVHGAFHGAWCWERLAVSLDLRGIESVAVDLPGHGGNLEPLGDLHEDAAALRSKLNLVGRPTVVLGHSYGGSVVAEAAAGLGSVISQVYVAAFVPQVGESPSDVIDSFHGPSGRPSEVGAVVRLPPEVAYTKMYHDCSPEVARWAVSRLGPQRSDTVAMAPTAAGWRDARSLYVVCTEDRVLPLDVQRFYGGRTSRVTDLRSGHSPQLSRPEELAEILLTELQALAS